MRYLAFILLFGLLFMDRALAEPGYREVNLGNRSYNQGDFKAAKGQYEKAAERNPRQALIDYDRGTAYYKDGEYDKAVEYLRRGLLTEDKKAIKNVYFNLGNALYQLGVSREDKDIGAAIKSLEEALPYYEKVLLQDLKDEDARINSEFVKKELERLKKKQQEQKQQQNNKTCPNPKKSDSSEGQKEDSSQKADEKPDQSQGSEQKQSSDQQKNEGQNREDNSQQDQGQEEQQAQQESGGEKKEDSSSNKEGQSEQKAASGQKEQSSSGQGDSGQILSQKEAKMLLDDFDQNEQPKGLMNFIRKAGNDRPVEKDW
ncbi:MAG: tetratricopeptide repeat protein [Candidatus Omnitrophica bacterium]|nr:tetratricopeptide repeat protein [Candidatus Omnitrophota bacterium]